MDLDECANRVYAYGVNKYQFMHDTNYKCPKCWRELGYMYMENRLYLFRCKQCKVVYLAEGESPEDAIQKIEETTEETIVPAMTVESGGCEWCSDLSKYRGFGYACFFEQFAVDEVHELSVEVKYCPNCGQKIEETTEETIVPAMTADEENLLREIAAWFPKFDIVMLNDKGIIKCRFSLDMYPSGIWSGTFGTSDMNSKAYEVLAPILEKYGDINLEDYR